MNRFTPLDIHLMGQALEEAQKAGQAGEVPVGAILADQDGQIISRGQNQVLTLNDPTAHAEIMAIRAAGKALSNYRLTGARLYVTLEPCPMCLMAAIHARLGMIYYGATEPKWGALGSLTDLSLTPGLNHNLRHIGGLLAQDCVNLISDFFKARRGEKAHRACHQPKG